MHVAAIREQTSGMTGSADSECTFWVLVFLLKTSQKPAGYISNFQIRVLLFSLNADLYANVIVLL